MYQYGTIARMNEESSSIQDFKKIIKSISPILVKVRKTSINIGLSKDFLLVQLLKSAIKKIEDDPYLNFISELKYYKVYGKLIHGPIEVIHRDINKYYMMDFFDSYKLYELVKADIEWVYQRNKKIKVSIHKSGYIIYDNYKKNKFNTLLLTIHSGTWLPDKIEEMQSITEEERHLEEDIDIHKIYSPLVLENAGIWIDNKLSRFACDYNRSEEKAIYKDLSEEWISKLWKTDINNKQTKKLLKGHKNFYLALTSLVNSYHFNIIFDGHSMKDAKNRAELSFGTKFIPKFYMPVVRSMKENFLKRGFEDVAFDKPFVGGHILEWLSQKYPNIFICSMEVNKKLYMNSSRTMSFDKKIQTLSKNIVEVFDIK